MRGASPAAMATSSRTGVSQTGTALAPTAVIARLTRGSMVESVLLMIAAGLLANIDRFMAGF